MKSILVYSENIILALQMIGKAKKLSNKIKVSVITNKEHTLDYSGYVHTVISSSMNNTESIKNAIIESSMKLSPDLILIGSTTLGRELAARVATVFEAGYANDCIDIQLGDHIMVKRFTYGGSTITTEIIIGKPAIVSVPNRVFNEVPQKDVESEILELNLPLSEPSIRVLETRTKKVTDAGLESAKVIVSAGRGFKRKDDLKLIEELAVEIDAKIGCSRPISADLGWIDQWIGISGKKVAPRLYIACGISGTIQHAAGIRESQTIVSINNDESAGIHEISDYSIIGDLYIILPALTKSLHKLKNNR